MIQIRCALDHQKNCMIERNVYYKLHENRQRYSVWKTQFRQGEHHHHQCLLWHEGNKYTLNYYIALYINPETYRSTDTCTPTWNPTVVTTAARIFKRQDLALKHLIHSSSLTLNDLTILWTKKRAISWNWKGIHLVFSSRKKHCTVITIYLDSRTFYNWGWRKH